MDAYKGRRIKQMLNELGKLKRLEVLVEKYTEGRTTDLFEMTVVEGNKLYISIDEDLNGKKSKMRKKVIHLLCLLGWVDDANKPDMPRINQFIMTIGSNNPNGKYLNRLHFSELKNVLNQVDTMVSKELKKK